jgi:DNA-binding response OmpR family regulator
MTTFKKKILIADDDPGILDALQMMLEDSGYDVRTTLFGQEIIDMDHDFPDLFLLDIWMSGIDGRNICKHLKSQDITTHIPVIMISANKDVQTLAKECGANDFLAKPFQMEKLLMMIETHIIK